MYCTEEPLIAQLDEVREELAIALPLVSASASTFMLKFIKSLYVPDHLIDLVHIWFDDRYSSKVLFSNTPAHYLKVKIMDLEIFNVKDF